MKREDLRKVEYKSKVWGNDGEAKYEWHPGYFHMWFNDFDYNEGFQTSELWAVIETEEGRINKIKSYDIKFVNDDNSFFGEVIVE